MGEHGPVGEVELGWGSALSELVWVWYSIYGCGVSVDWDGVCVEVMRRDTKCFKLYVKPLPILLTTQAMNTLCINQISFR